YQQAQRALSVGQEIHGGGAVTHFDQLGVFRLLSLIPDSTELRTYVDEVLGPLADSGDPDSADLREALRVLLETNLDVAAPAPRRGSSSARTCGRRRRCGSPSTTGCSRTPPGSPGGTWTSPASTSTRSRRTAATPRPHRLRGARRSARRSRCRRRRTCCSA